MHTSILLTFIFQLYLNTLFMNEVGECYLPSIVGKHCFRIILNEKECEQYLIKYDNYGSLCISVDIQDCSGVPSCECGYNISYGVFVFMITQSLF